MIESSQSQHCGKCGAVLSNDAPDGLCAGCLFESAFAVGVAVDGERARHGALFVFKDYEVLEEIARGGMGVVYRARQVSLNRMVAIKMLLSRHLANADGLQRFRAEAGIAAQLQHPNIVTIYEIGEHAGQPFFSMDLIEGRNLAQVVRDNPLPWRTAAAYLKTIAEAVHYAHSRGVLHRDLKPSNVMVDESGQLRITDFGIAKRFDDAQLSTSDPQLTQTGQLLGSPSFIPPEQAAGQKDAIGPASDVYSLGAILYQLITARPPLLAETMTQTLRMVAETEPVPPGLLNASVPRDLETICLKCLQKEPQRRYATAQELAEDLDHLLHDKPILARPVGRIGRLWRWARRNRALATTGAAVILLLLAVAVGAPIAAFKLNRERLRSQQVASFLKDMFTSFGPSALGQDTTVMRGILHTTAERVGRDLAGQPEVETELRDILGQTYRELALYKQMEEMARENLRFSQSHWGGEHLAVAAALQQLGEAMTLQGNHATAATYLRQALALERKLVGNEHPAVANTLETLALALKRQKQPHLVNEAEKLAREALAIQRKLFGNEHAYVANSLYNLGLVLRTAGKLGEAESAHKEALGLQRKLFGNESTAVAESLNSLAAVLHHEGKLAESEAVNREALAIYIKLFGKEHQFVANALGTLATTLVDQHKNAEAERMLKDVLTPAFASRPQSATFFRVRAGLFASQGRWIEASADASKVVQFEPAKQWGYQALTLLLVASGDLERYRHVCATNLDRFKSTKDADIAAQVARTCLILPSSGADLEAVDALAETAISMEEGNRFHHVFQFTKGLADYRQGRLSSAVEWMQKILIQTEPDALRDAKACAVLAMAQHQLHQPDEAWNFLRKARIAQSKWPNVENLDLRSNWRDWIMAQALVEEAGVLIEGPASRTNPFGTKSPQ